MTATEKPETPRSVEECHGCKRGFPVLREFREGWPVTLDPYHEWPTERRIPFQCGIVTWKVLALFAEAALRAERERTDDAAGAHMRRLISENKAEREAREQAEAWARKCEGDVVHAGEELGREREARERTEQEKNEWASRHARMHAEVLILNERVRVLEEALRLQMSSHHIGHSPCYCIESRRALAPAQEAK